MFLGFRVGPGAADAEALADADGAAEGADGAGAVGSWVDDDIAGGGSTTLEAAGTT